MAKTESKGSGSRGSKGSKGSEKQSWKMLSMSRRSVGRVHSSFSLHTRLASVLAEERQDAFDPSSTMAKVWDQILLSCLLLEAFLVPFVLAFQPVLVESVSALYVVVLGCEAVFVADLYVQAHTGYYSDGNLIQDKKRTIRRYIRSRQFALDIAAVLPCQLLVVVYPHVVAKVLFLKLLRWSRFPQLVSSLDEFYAKHFVPLKLFKVLASTLYLAHVLACVRYSFGDDDDHSNEWLPDTAAHSPSLSRHYLMSLFWSVGIMTGLYEGELPRHSSELLFTILVALCGFAMFTTLCATIFVISKCESGNTEAMEARINQLVHVLSFHRVPESQQAQAVEYLKRYYTDTESTDRETAKLLCPSIANDIQVELLKSTIARVSLFRGCTDPFIVAMTSLLELISVPAQTTLFSAGDYGDAMYVVHSGVLAIVVNSVTVREIRKGSCFGEVSVFSSIPRTATVVSSTYSILYKLSRFYCERVLRGYPDCAAAISSHLDEILKQLDSNDRDAGTIASNSAMPPVIPARQDFRRPSITAGGIAKVPHLVRMLSRKGSDMARSITPLLRKGSVSPAPRNSSRGRGTRIPFSLTTMNAVVLLSPTSSMSSGRGIRLKATYHHQRGIKLARVYKHRGFWRLVLLRRCIDHHSRGRLWWLLMLLVNLCYCWLMIPVQVTFPLWQQPSWMTQTVDTISNAGLALDLVLNLNLSFMVDSEKIMDPKRSAIRYFGGHFFFDLLCALPYEYLYMAKYGLMRLPRLLRVLQLKKQLREIEHFISFSSRRQLLLLGGLLFMMFHIVTCVHFGVSYLEGFDSNEESTWISPASLCLRRLNGTHLENCNGTIYDQSTSRGALQSITATEYCRSLYYALLVALTLMLSGFLISAIVVDNVQKRLTASAYEQREFFEASSRIQQFLRRQKAPLAIHQRTKSFLDYWWSSHRGAIIRELLADLPRPVRLELLRSICLPVLQTLALLQGVHAARDKLEEVLLENAKFILYGQGETVYRHGDDVTGMYFLLEGEVSVVKMGGSPCELSRGGFFGAAALTQRERGEGYTEHVSANSGCILLFISRSQLQALEAIFPAIKAELFALDQRLLRYKMASMSVSTDLELSPPAETTAQLLHIVRIRVKAFFTAVYDPDLLFTVAWETWVFVVMTLQWILVMFLACFPVEGGHGTADAVIVFLELSFVMDMCIRTRLGFYEFGNKIMAPDRIKHEYLKSRTFALDIAALLPLYIINWCVPTSMRWDLLNINKLLRLLKVPKQLQALETRYLKRTTELHLFKLLYYTFMLSHILGCLWFNFASKVAAPKFSGSLPSNSTAFGDNPWLPSEALETGPQILQYMASLYWSFGLMSSSGESEFPQTTGQCIFSVVTMTSGFFLFAYVIGNFTDIIELRSSDTRDFNANMGAVRQMLAHFKMPAALQERVNTFLLFKRYHTITREHILVNCLPPSLLTDIRLVYLKPMIEKVEFLAGMEASITRMLVSQFRQVLVSRGEFVFKYGDSGSDMFFVFAGLLDVFLPSDVAAKNAFKAIAGKRSGDSVVLNAVAGPSNNDIDGSARQASAKRELKKVNEISAGSYFGENGLFTNGKRDAYVKAQTSCILYRLSRESLELVFDRYPLWRQKVLTIANIHREQARLVQLSREEQRRGMTTSTGLVLSRSDIMNERAEGLKEMRYHTRVQRTSSAQSDYIGQVLVDRLGLKRVSQLLNGLVHGAAVQSSFYLCWLRLMVACTAYVTIMIPYELTMESMDRTTVVVVLAKVLELLCEVAFVVDVWFWWHVHECPASMELYDQNLRSVYTKERMVWDVIAAIPVYDLLRLFNCSRWFKCLRCIKIFNIGGYLDELNRRSVASQVTRFWHVWTLYLLMIYWTACAYLAVASEVGFAEEWQSWLPAKELEISDPENPSSAQLVLRLLRGLFFAATTFVKKTYNPAPEVASLFAFHIAISFIGLLVMSFVIGELASLFISFIGLEVGFRKNYIAVELYLARLRVSDQLRTRTYAFMTSLWSSHAGVNYEELLADMPRDIRAACVLHVSKEPLDWFVMKVATPVCWEGEDSVEALTRSLAERLRFESYPRAENVVTEGSIVRAMYFVIKGHLKMQSGSLLNRPLGLRDGSYFGERGLLGCTISVYTVHTVRACDLLSLSSEVFAEVLQKHPFSRLALKLCDRAYKHLTSQNLAACSKSDMEEHWGTAILHSLQSIQTCNRITAAAAQKGTPGHVVRNGDALTANLTALSTSLTAGDAAKSATESSAPVDHGAHETIGEDTGHICRLNKGLGELPAHIDDMLEALNTTQSCFEAFAPLLHILLPTDPLDWKASFGASFTGGTKPTDIRTTERNNVSPPPADQGPAPSSLATSP